MKRLTNKFKILQNFSGDGFKARLLKGGALLGAGNGMEQALRLVRNMLLARILAPEAFGLMAIILAVNSAMESFTQIGIREAIVQNKHSEDVRYLNAAWWLAFGRSVGLLVVGLLASPWIGKFYGISENIGLLQLSLLAILFNGAVSAKAYIAQKKMEYSKWVVIMHGGGACGILTAIACSIVFHNVLALVVGFVVEAGARCLLSFILCPYVPRFRFSLEHSTSLFRYAKGMFGLPILHFIFTQSPIFVLAKVVSPAELGIYSLAASLAQAPTQMAITLMNQVLMPAFSSRQDNKEWLNQAILKTTRLVVYLCIPAGVYVCFYSHDILSLVYGSQYAVASIPFSILVITTLLSAFTSPIVNVYLALGQPRLHRLFSGIRAFIIMLVIYPAIIMFGLTGAALAALFSMAVSYQFQVARIHGLTNLNTVQYYRIFFNALVASLAVPVVWVCTNNVFSQKTTINLISGFLGCCLVYGLGLNYYRKKIIKNTIADTNESAGAGNN
jgi:O-antigen/teichoic acid export membrane protein